MTRFLLLAACAVALASAQARRAPGFALPDLKQQYHDMNDYRGKVVLIELMKTDCPNCKEMAAMLDKMKAKYAGRVQVLSIVTMPDTLQTVQKFVADNKVTSPVLFDCGQVMASYLQMNPRAPKPVHLPALFVVDTKGFIRQQLEGQVPTPQALAATVETALKQ